MNPLLELQKYGQSIWYDNIERRLLTGGGLARMIAEDGVTGLTSNPTIFEKAIGGSRDYDEAIAALAAQGRSVEHIYEALAIEDIRQAADLLCPIYDRTNGVDGYVSLEVSPHLAYDTEKTVAEARRLFAAVNRANLMIKVPGTPEGIPAIEELIGSGINVNVTLLFAISAYEEAAWAYIRGLERLAAAGGDVSRVASVASFFVSRIDTSADKRLQARLAATEDPAEQAALRSLLGQIAIANSKLAYQRFLQIFADPRFRALAARGARVQRMLWASTSTKNPAYRDTRYVEELIGPDTVNTVPQVTLDAFRDHGVVRGATVLEGVDEARAAVERLEALGISLAEITAEVLEQGVQAFAASYDQLMAVIAAKRAALLVPAA
ncbi:MAG: transaldolase [Caldilineales bacterium]|nr:transaldolase [Caldilineales bacterium]MDW8318771.1 transaldolase [Anaerolineae bacterium]